MNIVTDYDARSLHHERRMRELYRKGAASDDALLQPLANACWRAAAFEWQVHEDATAARSLWEEAARALAEGFARKRAGFEQSAEQLILGLHFSIAAKATDVTKSLVLAKVTVASNSRAPRAARAMLLLSEGYQLVVRALIERKQEHARDAQRLLTEARVSGDREEEHQVSGVAAADWQVLEHEATRALLSVIARHLQARPALPVSVCPPDCEAATREFAGLMDAALLNLDKFLEAEVNHRPKLYCWLPGIALSVLAGSAGLSLDWLNIVALEKHGPSRLPTKLVLQAEDLSARVNSAGIMF